MNMIKTLLQILIIFYIIFTSMVVQAEDLRSAVAATLADEEGLNPNETVWAVMSENFHMDASDPRVQKQIKIMLADKKSFTQILSRSEPYIYYIYQQTKDRNLPAEVALLPVVESEFSPHDYSSAGAKGLWQLMPGTARLMGVKVKGGYDGRKDVVASTGAALTFFKDLGNEFNGNWDLALAAYNAGDGRIKGAIRHDHTNDYWRMTSLPLETRVYVPKLLAVAEIVKHPDKYGITLPPISNKPYFTELKVNKPVSLATVSKQYNYDPKVLKKLNPEYGQQVVKKNGSYSVLVPLKA